MPYVAVRVPSGHQDDGVVQVGWELFAPCENDRRHRMGNGRKELTWHVDQGYTRLSF